MQVNSTESADRLTPNRYSRRETVVDMARIVELETDRLRLRQWKDSDFPIFAEMNADPIVMEYYPSTLKKQESDEVAKTFQSLILERGWGFWALERKSDEKFVGFVGLHEPQPDLPFSPCVEIGWRLAKKYWGEGYATEAAKQALKFAFEVLLLSNVYSFTSVLNLRSRAVMERLNMVNVNQNFLHPKVPDGSPLKEHVLYKITKDKWNETAI